MRETGQRAKTNDFLQHVSQGCATFTSFLNHVTKETEAPWEMGTKCEGKRIKFSPSSRRAESPHSLHLQEQVFPLHKCTTSKNSMRRTEQSYGEGGAGQHLALLPSSLQRWKANGIPPEKWKRGTMPRLSNILERRDASFDIRRLGLGRGRATGDRCARWGWVASKSQSTQNSGVVCEMPIFWLRIRRERPGCIFLPVKVFSHILHSPSGAQRKLKFPQTW